MYNLYYADLWIMPTIDSKRALAVAIAAMEFGIITVPPEMREACRSVENDREWLTLELSRPVRVRTRNLNS